MFFRLCYFRSEPINDEITMSFNYELVIEFMKLIENTETGLGKLMAGNYNLGTVKLYANSKQIWLQYLGNRSLSNVIIHRDDNSSTAFNEVIFDPARQLNFNSPVGATETEWIFYSSNENLSAYKEHIDQLAQNKADILNQINPNTNGVLTLVKLR